MTTEDGNAPPTTHPRVVHDPGRGVIYITADLEQLREQLWERRLQRVERDPEMDPALKELFLDRTLIGTARVKDELGLSSHRVWMLRENMNPGLPQPHPSLLPPTVAVGKTVMDRADPLVEVGELAFRRWQAGRDRWNPSTRKLEKRPVQRPGSKMVMDTYGKPRAKKADGPKKRAAPKAAGQKQ